MEKYRIVLSRLAAVPVLLSFFTTQSYWEGKNELLTFTLFFIGMVLVGVASLGRMWCSLYTAEYKDSVLITQGPYSISRNPLYFFSMIGVAGIGCATETFTFPLVFVVIFALYYRYIIKHEENHLKKLFGDSYEEYLKHVPVFFPRFSLLTEPDNYCVKPVRYRKHMYSALWFVWIIGVLEVIEGLKEIGVLSPPWTIY